MLALHLGCPAWTCQCQEHTRHLAGKSLPEGTVSAVQKEGFADRGDQPLVVTQPASLPQVA